MSVTEIQQRMATIQARFLPAAPATTTTAATTATATATTAATTGATPFAAALEGALRELPAQAGDSAVAWGTTLPATARPYLPLVEQAAGTAGIDPRLVAAVAWTESGFRPDAVSGAGAIGLMQLMPGTAAGLGVDPRDPAANLAGGARYLAQQLERFGSVDRALAAYNAGPARVAASGGVPAIPETQQYVHRVLERFQQLVASSPLTSKAGR